MSIPQEKCAPGKEYKEGSCFTYESLKKIANNYNKYSNTKISNSLNKKELVNALENKLKDKCDEQTCWLRLDIVKQLEDNDIEENTFRPKGPTKKYEWLSTTHINEVINQYMNVHKDFLFLGAVPYDFDDIPLLGIKNINFKELENKGKYRLGMVINLDEHYKSGSHWVALFTDLKKNQVYFFDSVGKPPGKRIRKLINRIIKYFYKRKFNKELNINEIIKYKNTDEISKNFHVDYNNIQHQKDDSECGVYSINAILSLIDGISFEKLCSNIIPDDEINKERNEYFRNVNFTTKST